MVQVTDSSVGVLMTDETGAVVLPVSDYLHSLSAGDARPATIRSYALALLRWWRFLVAVDVRWDTATSVEVRDFVLWMRLRYAPATINHNLAVLHGFYATAPAVHHMSRSPIPERVGADDQRVHAHHNPMRPFARNRRARLRQKTAKTIPHGLPDHAFDALFAVLRNDRDRALLAFYVSTGARASELLTVTEDRVDVGRQVIGVHRKGSGRLQWLPASADSFVWLRLYQQRQPRMGGERALWLTLRPPYRPLTYSAMRRVLQRANETLGTSWTLHDLRHTAAQRMIADPAMSLTDVQWVLGHAYVTTTQIYLQPREDEIVARVLAHYEQRGKQKPPTPPLAGYSPDALRTLFGEHHHDR